MSYDNVSVIPFKTVAITTTAAAATYGIRGPKGKAGRVVDIVATCTTDHVVGTTTPTQLLVGLSGDTNAYATFEPPALTAATGVANLLDADSANSEIVAGHLIPADTEVLLTTVANTGGTPAGVLEYDVLIAWEN